VSDRTRESDRIVIGVDPQRRRGQPPRKAPGCGRWPRSGCRLTRSATATCAASPPVSPAAVWAIEGAGGLGAPLATRLSADGIAAVDVPAKLAARVRMLSTGHGRKNDDAGDLGCRGPTRTTPRSTRLRGADSRATPDRCARAGRPGSRRPARRTGIARSGPDFGEQSEVRATAVEHRTQRVRRARARCSCHPAAPADRTVLPALRRPPPPRGPAGACSRSRPRAGSRRLPPARTQVARLVAVAAVSPDRRRKGGHHFMTTRVGWLTYSGRGRGGAPAGSPHGDPSRIEEHHDHRTGRPPRQARPNRHPVTEGAAQPPAGLRSDRQR
jgi:hypothetical protein